MSSQEEQAVTRWFARRYVSMEISPPARIVLYNLCSVVLYMLVFVGIIMGVSIYSQQARDANAQYTKEVAGLLINGSETNGSTVTIGGIGLQFLVGPFIVESERQQMRAARKIVVNVGNRSIEIPMNVNEFNLGSVAPRTSEGMQAETFIREQQNEFGGLSRFDCCQLTRAFEMTNLTAAGGCNCVVQDGNSLDPRGNGQLADMLYAFQRLILQPFQMLGVNFLENAYEPLTSQELQLPLTVSHDAVEAAGDVVYGPEKRRLWRTPEEKLVASANQDKLTMHDLTYFTTEFPVDVIYFINGVTNWVESALIKDFMSGSENTLTKADGEVNTDDLMQCGTSFIDPNPWSTDTATIFTANNRAQQRPGYISPRGMLMLQCGSADGFTPMDPMRAYDDVMDPERAFVVTPPFPLKRGAMYEVSYGCTFLNINPDRWSLTREARDLNNDNNDNTGTVGNSAGGQAQVDDDDFNDDDDTNPDIFDFDNAFCQTPSDLVNQPGDAQLQYGILSTNSLASFIEQNCNDDDAVIDPVPVVIPGSTLVDDEGNPSYHDFCSAVQQGTCIPPSSIEQIGTVAIETIDNNQLWYLGPDQYLGVDLTSGCGLYHLQPILTDQGSVVEIAQVQNTNDPSMSFDKTNTTFWNTQIDLDPLVLSNTIYYYKAPFVLFNESLASLIMNGSVPNCFSGMADPNDIATQLFTCENQPAPNLGFMLEFSGQNYSATVCNGDTPNPGVATIVAGKPSDNCTIGDTCNNKFLNNRFRYFDQTILTNDDDDNDECVSLRYNDNDALNQNSALLADLPAHNLLSGALVNNENGTFFNKGINQVWNPKADLTDFTIYNAQYYTDVFFFLFNNSMSFTDPDDDNVDGNSNPTCLNRVNNIALGSVDCDDDDQFNGLLPYPIEIDGNLYNVLLCGTKDKSRKPALTNSIIVAEEPSVFYPINSPAFGADPNTGDYTTTKSTSDTINCGRLNTPTVTEEYLAQAGQYCDSANNNQETLCGNLGGLGLQLYLYCMGDYRPFDDMSYNGTRGNRQDDIFMTIHRLNPIVFNPITTGVHWTTRNRKRTHRADGKVFVTIPDALFDAYGTETMGQCAIYPASSPRLVNIFNQQTGNTFQIKRSELLKNGPSILGTPTDPIFTGDYSSHNGNLDVKPVCAINGVPPLNCHIEVESVFPPQSQQSDFLAASNSANGMSSVFEKRSGRTWSSIDPADLPHATDFWKGQRDRRPRMSEEEIQRKRKKFEAVMRGRDDSALKEMVKKSNKARKAFNKKLTDKLRLQEAESKRNYERWKKREKKAHDHYAYKPQRTL